MRIGVLANLQHSMFSSGTANTSLAVAELFRELGHTVELVHCDGSESAWWIDCTELQANWKVQAVSAIQEASTPLYDVLFEIGILQFPPALRSKAAARTIWIVRNPYLVREIEECIYPRELTPQRNFDGLYETWILDGVATEDYDMQILELLTRAPVRKVPYLWTPTIPSTYLKSIGSPSWISHSIQRIKESRSKDTTMPPWTVHISETNSTSSSSCLLPLVILKELVRRGTKVGKWVAHNSEKVSTTKFFQENTINLCKSSDLSGVFVGRQRSVDWVTDSMSCVLSHIRFTKVRPALLDLVWAGIPLVHNSPVLYELGHGLERTYYNGNRIGEACTAWSSMETDLQQLQGAFSEECLAALRRKMTDQFAPSSTSIQALWGAAFSGCMQGAGVPLPLPSEPLPLPSEPAPAAVALPPPVIPNKEGPKILNIGFCDMWTDFNPSYNFFTLLLSAYSPTHTIVGGPATASSDLVLFGPFGTAWQQLPKEIPKVFFTGENTGHIELDGVSLYLTFCHEYFAKEDRLRFPLWFLEIDWFGADANKIQNPKPIPLLDCVRVREEDMARKTKFCAFVVSNPKNPLRNAAYHWLNDYKPVDSAGALFNTVGPVLQAGPGGGGGELKKFEFLKDYKFCIAYENGSTEGYTTEKYLHAKAAGCVPIYWGDPWIARDFDTTGAIIAQGAKSEEELVALVQAVDTNNEEWKKRFMIPALDEYKVELVRRTMAECARRMFALMNCEVPGPAPKVIGMSRDQALASDQALATGQAKPQEAKPATPILATAATHRFLSSLKHWLSAAETQKRAIPSLQAIVFLGSDVSEDTEAALATKYPFTTFERMPEDQIPPSFPDFWAPQHYGWKLWIYQELSGRPALAGRTILYTDAGSFMCRWPAPWIKQAESSGLCFLEDPRETNDRWCSASFCSALQVTPEEKTRNQVLGGLMAFVAGHPAATTLFSEAYRLAQNPQILVGPKWEGVRADGKPFGHRHDQSILSILACRAGSATAPLDDYYCDTSLRKTFTTGKSLYVHRGQFTVSRPFGSNISEAYVINLARRADRMEKLWTNNPELKGRVERWNAVEGKALALTPAIARLLKPNDFFWKKAVAGCALSHLGLWHKLANDTPDIENYLILEDDVKFQPGWEGVWTRAVAAEEVPESYDIIYLGGVLPPNRPMFDKAGRERINPSFSRIASNTLFQQPQPSRFFHFCAYSYVLSKRGAQKIMSLLETMGGYWTSADHILCNPVDILESYVFDPLVAGCYQDDDPKYANSQFNDFSRIDGFDSDLWTNDERWTEEERSAALATAPVELSIATALRDAQGQTAVAKTEVLEKVPLPSQSLLQNPKSGIKLAPTRLVSVVPLDIYKLYERDWLLELFGNPSMLTIETILPGSAPPEDCPLVVTLRGHTEETARVLSIWDDAGAPFRVLHLSDEYCNEPIDFYELSACKKVFRVYVREDIPTAIQEKVITIPLGYHWTKGSRGPALPFRMKDVSFIGTDWHDRKAQLQPLFDPANGLRSYSKFYSAWNDPESLCKEDYIGVLMDSIFVACPDGNNPETYRFYETIEAGAIPLVVRTERNTPWLKQIQEKIPILPFDSWDLAFGFVRFMLDHKEKLEQYRAAILSSWAAWKKVLQEVLEKSNKETAES